MYKIIEVKQSVFEDNNKDANKLREECKDKGVFLLNVMSCQVQALERQQLYLER